MPVRPFVLSIPVLVSLFLLGSAQGAVPALERQALIAFYNSTGGPNWYDKMNWLGPEGTEGTWLGVTTDSEHVIGISLPGNGLVGTVPPEIGNLPYLRQLDLTGVRDPGSWGVPLGVRNRVSGISPEISRLSRLEGLSLAQNDLESIPEEIGGLAALTYLSLDQNQLEEVPSSLGQLASLETLDLSQNLLTSLPAQIGLLARLTHLDVRHNRLTSLPPEIGNLTQLDYLGISQNQLTTLPRELGNLSKLPALNLWSNPLTEIPSELGLLPNLVSLSFGNVSRLPTGLGAMKNVEELQVSGGFTELSSEVGEMANLLELQVTDNPSLRSLPSSLARLTKLELLDVTNNGFREIPPVIGQMTSLQSLFLGGNPLRGPIPANLGNLTRLKALVLLQDNWIAPLSGPLPPELGNMASLEKLILGGEFTGPIPAEFGNLSNLQVLKLYGQFTEIPAEIARLQNLVELDIRGDQKAPPAKAPFRTIPPEIGGMTSLTSLVLVGSVSEIPPEFGNLTGLTNLWLTAEPQTPIPGELGNLKNLTSLRLNGGFSGAIPAELAGLDILRFLDLSDNQLTGSIPIWVSDLVELRQLILRNNRLEGTIPTELSNLRFISTLDLSRNSLTGSIPPELAGLTSASHIDLSHNRLEGNVPYQIVDTSRYRVFNASSNRLAGRLPKELGELKEKSWMVRVNFRWNALYPVEVPVFEFIGLRHNGDFGGTQSYAPFDLAAAGMGDTVRLSWSPISYQADSGGYEVLYRQREDEPWTVYGMTNSKTVTSFTVTGLETGRDYYFALRTVTYPHANNRNTVVGEPGNVAWAGTTPSAETWLPFYPDGPGQYIGLAITNTAGSDMHGRVLALGGSGQPTAFPRNPIPLSLPAGRQQTAVDSQIFGATSGSQPWSIHVSADRTPVTLCLQGGPGLLDGAAGLTGTHKALYFPRVYQGAGVLAGKDAVSRVNLVNPGTAPVQVRLQLVGPEIDTAGTATVRTIAPGGLVSETLTELFGLAQPISEAYIEAHALEGDGFNGAVVVTGGEGSSAFVIPGAPASGFSQLAAAQVASGPGITTSLRVINTDPAKRVLTVRLYPDSGDSRAHSLEIPAGGLLDRNLADLFDLPEALTAASILVAADGTGVLGDILVHGPDLSYASAVPLSGRTARHAVFGYIANGLGVFTGLAMFNPGNEPAAVAVEVLSPDGSSRGTASVNLAAKGRLARHTAELVPSSAGSVGGYIRVTTTQPVILQEMFAGSSLEYMATVPPVIVR